MVPFWGRHNDQTTLLRCMDQEEIREVEVGLGRSKTVLVDGREQEGH